ncbi:MAG: N-acetyltransferase [Acidobacteria bacterium]|nr:N-acetyltransferase [Acidobacteriota bacterium]MCI0718260.1 N-acetyltransferase [Acidobacteriota bacterium]
MRRVRAVHGLRSVKPDPDFEIGLSTHLRVQYTQERLLELYDRFCHGAADFDSLMRRVIWRACARKFGDSVTIGSGVGFKHVETFEIGNGAFIGAHSYIQGRFDGTCSIGDHVWIGPQSYFDARQLVLEDYVGWGPGAKVLGSSHTGCPSDLPIIQTDLEIKPVRIEAWSDIGTNAVILPGVTVGKGSVVGAGAVVTHDVLPFSVVAGVPARFLHWREGYESQNSDEK